MTGYDKQIYNRNNFGKLQKKSVTCFIVNGDHLSMDSILFYPHKKPGAHILKVERIINQRIIIHRTSGYKIILISNALGVYF